MEPFTATFLVVFRETLEASLIVGTILTILVRLHSLKYRSPVLAGVAVALGLSFAIGLGLHEVTEKIQGVLEKWMEAMISLSATSILTFLVFWMDRQAQRIRPKIEERVERAVSRGEYLTMIFLPFFAVLREGMETVLFLHAVAIQHAHRISVLGSAMGLTGALAVAGLIFIGGKRVPLHAFFRTTGFLLLLIAAGLLTSSIHEFQGLGLLPLRQTAWNLNPLWRPSILEVLAASLYLLGVGFFLTAGSRRETIPFEFNPSE